MTENAPFAVTQKQASSITNTSFASGTVRRTSDAGVKPPAPGSDPGVKSHSMEKLRQQALGIISVCKTALAVKGKDYAPVDNPTIAIAQAILAQAKAALPDDKVLAAVKLDPPVSFWTTLQTAMEIVDKSTPSPESITLAKAMEAGRKRVEKHEQSITDALAGYKSALAEYERLSPTESPSYSIIEIAKLKVADAFLDSRKIPTGPAKKNND